MGVPVFFAWWASAYPERILYKKLPYGNVVLYLDFNGGIHPAVRTDPFLPFDEMNPAVCEYLDKTIAYVKPTEVWIAIDGVAPEAKMNQQRERRYKSAKESKYREEKCIKYSEPYRKDKVDFNMISPGTEFMADLQKYLEEHIALSKDTIWKTVKKVTLCGSSIPGEGEHKIMEDIRQRREAGRDDKVCIYGLDADLIFLSLLNAPNAFLVRENVHFRGRDRLGLDKETYPYVYFDIENLREIIIDTMDPECTIADLARMGFKYDRYLFDKRESENKYTRFYDHSRDQQRLIWDFVYLCFLLGNDFLPRLPSLKIRNGALPNMVMFYKYVAWDTGGFLINGDGTPNRRFLYRLLCDLEACEDEMMICQTEKRMKDVSRHRYRMTGKSDFEKAMEDFNYIENKYDDVIDGGTAGWRQRYYDYHFNMKYRHKKEARRNILPICQEYMRGMSWVFQYYTGRHHNWSWSYNYIAAPTLADLVDCFEDLTTDNEFEDTEPVDPYVQLLSILPPDSSKLLPPALRGLMTDKDSPIHYMYPLKITLSMIGNKFWHECKPYMPMVDREELKDIVEAKQKYLTEEERRRNSRQPVLTW